MQGGGCAASLNELAALQGTFHAQPARAETGKPPTSEAQVETLLYGDPARTLVTVYKALKEVAEVIIICYEIYKIAQELGIIDGRGVHEPGEPYMPYWPYPHFDIINGQIIWY